MRKNMRIGVLAVQGAFIEHERKLAALSTQVCEIRKACDLDREMDGIILPGGESTVMGKLLRDLGMMERLTNMVKGGLPVFGTCAGLILLASEINPQQPSHIGTMDIVVRRNAYGRQLGSFVTIDQFDGKDVPMTFIRAPYIEQCAGDVKVLSRVNGKIVAACQDDQLVTAFHPELDEDNTVHRYFIQMCWDYIDKLKKTAL
jgi:5'-phosphate synthase pdxT subunit